MRSAKGRRRFALIILALTLGPGSVLTYVFRDDVWWVNLQSLVALWLSAAAWWAAETPVEVEK